MSINKVKILEASREQILPLKRQIRSHDGLLNVVVHPDYHKRDIAVLPRARYILGYKELVATGISGRLPLVVFEEEKFGYQPSLSPRGHRQVQGGSLYTVETESDDPTPVQRISTVTMSYVHAMIARSSSREEIFRRKELMLWQGIHKIFRYLGVTEIRLSGQYFWRVKAEEIVNPDKRVAANSYSKRLKSWSKEYPQASRWISPHWLPAGCVGTAAIMFLEGGFDVSFSSLTSPEVIGLKNT